MFAWIRELFVMWKTWEAGYHGGQIADVWAPYLFLISAALGFCIFAAIAREDDQGFWKTLGMGLGGALAGLIVALVIILLGIMPFPYVVLFLGTGATFIALFALLFYGRELFRFGWKWALLLPNGLSKGIAAIRRLVVRRRDPEDHLLEVDRRAQEVDDRRQELIKRRDRLTGRIHDLKALEQEAEMRRKDAKEGSAAERIAEDVLQKFRAKIASAQTCHGGLVPVINLVREYQNEMHNLIGLARLCRKANEPDLAQNDEQAIAEARATLALLSKACELADVALSSVVVEAPDADVGLAFKQIEDGLRRSHAFQKAVDQLQVPAPSGVRA